MINIEGLEKVIANDKESQKWLAPGWCRKWSDAVMDVLEESMLFDNVEAREVEVVPDFWHTFVRATTIDGESYLFDNSVDSNRKPFMGNENEAPSYLLGSKRDNFLMTDREFRYSAIDKKCDI